MKKIGLAVCYDTKNFGSQLQVLATIKKIEELGYQTEIIRYKKKISPKFIMQTIPRFFNGYFIWNKYINAKKKFSVSWYPEIKQKISVRNERFQKFQEKYFTNVSAWYLGWENLVNQSADNYDMFLCGSDQLWRPQNLGSHFYTLEFASDDKPKIAYATSFGVKQIPWYQKKRTANYLNRFKYLSTREISGYHIIKELAQKESAIVCDPTLLMDCSEWLNVIPHKETLSKAYVLCYFLGNNPKHRKLANKFAEDNHLKLVTCPFLDNFVKEDINFGDIQLFDFDSEDFVNMIRNAEYILTDSFHGTVFSILNHKKFLVFNRFQEGANSRNSRIDSLCSILDLSNRRYQSDVNVVKQEINYQAVDEKLQEFRSTSIKYLKDSLA